MPYKDVWIYVFWGILTGVVTLFCDSVDRSYCSSQGTLSAALVDISTPKHLVGVVGMCGDLVI
jgi:hypothetical protein